MGEVISFVRLSKEGCESPIRVRKPRRTAMLVDFSAKLFNGAHLETALNNVMRHQVYWFGKKIRPNDNGYVSKNYHTYFISVNGYCATDADEILAQILHIFVRSVYLEESRIKLYIRHDVTELMQSRRDNLRVDSHTTKLLQKAGIYSLQELSSRTREELCAIPEMTTREVYNLECALASRGCFLTPSEIS